MSFWDSSGLVAVLIAEPRSDQLRRLYASQGPPAVWWVTPVECHSAITRRARDGALSSEVAARALDRLELIIRDVATVAATNEVRDRARRLLGVHLLKAADALQLAAALVWCEEQPVGERFVCLDERLRAASRREGFALLPA